MNFLDKVFQQLNDVPSPENVVPELGKNDLFRPIDPDVQAEPNTSQSLIKVLQQIERNTRPVIQDEPSYNVHTLSLATTSGERIFRNNERTRFVTITVDDGDFKAYIGSGKTFFAGFGNAANTGMLCIQSPFLTDAVTVEWQNAATGKNMTVVFSSEPFCSRQGT